MNEPRPPLPGHGHPAPAQPAHPHQPQIRPPAAMPRPAGVQPVPERAGPGSPVPAGPGGAPPPLPAARRPAHDDGPIDLIELEEAPQAGHAPPAGAGGAGKPQITHATPLGAGGGAAAGAVGGISPASKIKISAGGDKHTYTRFKRNVTMTGQGATRVRSFHGRLSDDGLAYTDDKINEWLDSHPEIEVKHVNCLVGPLEGKVTGEQGLIVVIWY